MGIENQQWMTAADRRGNMSLDARNHCFPFGKQSVQRSGCEVDLPIFLKNLLVALSQNRRLTPRGIFFKSACKTSEYGGWILRKQATQASLLVLSIGLSRPGIVLERTFRTQILRIGQIIGHAPALSGVDSIWLFVAEGQARTCGFNFSSYICSESVDNWME